MPMWDGGGQVDVSLSVSLSVLLIWRLCAGEMVDSGEYEIEEEELGCRQLCGSASYSMPHLCDTTQNQDPDIQARRQNGFAPPMK